MLFLVVFSIYLYHRRNTVQTCEKVDRIYLTLQEWSSCLADTGKQLTTAARFSSLNLSMAEAEDLVYRLRCLVDKSDYNDQVLLFSKKTQWGLYGRSVRQQKYIFDSKNKFIFMYPFSGIFSLWGCLQTLWSCC